MKIIERTFDVITGETVEIERNLTAAEIAEAQQLQAIADQRVAEEAEQVAAKAALLSKLGITEDEAKLLLS
jgi:hypothetical protein